MSAQVLLNLLNELEKRDRMRGLPSILSLFRNEFNKFNNTRARMLDSIYHMIKSHFCRKNVVFFFIMYATLLWTSQRFPKIDKPLVVYRFYCMALFHSQTRRHMTNCNYAYKIYYKNRDCHMQIIESIVLLSAMVEVHL